MRLEFLHPTSSQMTDPRHHPQTHLFSLVASPKSFIFLVLNHTSFSLSHDSTNGVSFLSALRPILVRSSSGVAVSAATGIIECQQTIDPMTQWYVKKDWKNSLEAAKGAFCSIREVVEKRRGWARRDEEARREGRNIMLGIVILIRLSQDKGPRFGLGWADLVISPEVKCL